MSFKKFRVESGMQVLARLRKKPHIENFYPNLFKSRLKLGHTIEIYSEDDISNLLSDIICEALIPMDLDGKEAGVIFFTTDGKLNFDIFVTCLQNKIMSRTSDTLKIESVLQNILHNLFIFEIYNGTQLHTTIHKLESILINHPNVSLVIFDTLTAFYWSEQNSKITKMDSYLKSMLRIIQNVVKDYKVVIIYSRPEYFSTSKEKIENLELCHEEPILEHLNYRIQVVFTEDGKHYADVRTHNDLYKSYFRFSDNNYIQWL